MARRIRYSELETPTARERLRKGKVIHWRAVVVGKVALGYRRRQTKLPGVWLRRVYRGTDDRGIGSYRQEVIGHADDFEDANGSTVLSYSQALVLAQDQKVPSGPISVSEALDLYFSYLDAQGKSTTDLRQRARVHIVPRIGDLDVAKLTRERIRRWLNDVATSPALVRGKKGAVARPRGGKAEDETVRRRRANANRILTILKAALNHAFDEGRVASADAWGRRVKPFRGVNVARARYLTIAEAGRLVNACDPDFRKLVTAALQTGARYSELTRLEVRDFNPDAGTVHIRQSKSGRDRHVILTEEGAAFFEQVTAGRKGSETIFLRADGGTWGPAHQRRRMVDANKIATIDPPINFHGLRHTWASHAVMNGIPLMVVARNLGHANIAMVQKHYGHLAEDYVVDAIRRGGPRFGLEPGNVRLIGQGKRSS